MFAVVVRLSNNAFGAFAAFIVLLAIAIITIGEVAPPIGRMYLLQNGVLFGLFTYLYLRQHWRDHDSVSMALLLSAWFTYSVSMILAMSEAHQWRAALAKRFDQYNCSHSTVEGTLSAIARWASSLLPVATGNELALPNQVANFELRASCEQMLHDLATYRDSRYLPWMRSGMWQRVIVTINVAYAAVQLVQILVKRVIMRRHTGWTTNGIGMSWPKLPNISMKGYIRMSVVVVALAAWLCGPTILDMIPGRYAAAIGWVAHGSIPTWLTGGGSLLFLLHFLR